MPLAFQHAEKRTEGSNVVAVLVRHDAGDLVEMGQIVRSPGSQQMREREDAEGRVATKQFKLLRLEIQGAQIIKTAGANVSKFVEKLRETFASALLDMSAAIEGIEGFVLAVLKDPARTRHPVKTIGIDEVANNIEDREGFAAFVVVRPGFGKAAQQSIKRSRGSLKQRYRVLQIVCHVSSMRNRLGAMQKDRNAL